MRVAVELRARIEETERQIQKDYGKTLEIVEKLKTKMNKLEQQTPDTQNGKALDSAIKRLNRITDSHILRSKKAWEEYRKFEHECKQRSQYPVQMDNLRAMCKKTEDLAADLLCYSLARFKQIEQQP